MPLEIADHVLRGTQQIESQDIATTPLRVRAKAGQTADLQQWQASNGAVYSRILSDGTVDLNSHRIINVTNPTGAQDAATKSYVDGPPTRKLLTLASSVSNYHQACRPLFSGTFIADRANVDLIVNLAATVYGASYSAQELMLAVGTPNGSGDIFAPAWVGTPLAPVAAAGATLTGWDEIGVLGGEDYVRGTLSAQFVTGYGGIPALTVGNTYTAMIYAAALSGYDVLPAAGVAGGLPSGSTPGNMALTASNDYFLVMDYFNNRVCRVAIGRRPNATYHGLQQRLLYRDQIAVGAGPLKVACDKNNVAATANLTAKTITVFSAADGAAMSVIYTSAVQTVAAGGIAAMPDGSGFWVASTDGKIRKFPASGSNGQAPSATWTVGDGTSTTQYGIVIDPTNTYAYVTREDKNDVVRVQLSNGTSTTMATNANGIVNAREIVIAPDNSALYVGRVTGGNTIWRIPLPGGGVSTSITLASGPIAQLAISADSWMLFAAEGSMLWFGRASDLTTIQEGGTQGAATANALVVTDNEGAYIGWSTGIVDGFPGTTLVVNPAGAEYGLARVLIVGGH